MKPKPVFVCLIGTMSTFAFVMTSPKGGAASSSTTRCFCNEASCVRTGYMCKSALNLCYSVVVLSGADDDGGGGHRLRSIHGCADTQPETIRGACATGSDRRRPIESNDAAAKAASSSSSSSSSSTNGNERVLCCGHDMCNYIDGAGVVLLSAIVTNRSTDDTLSSDVDRDRPAGVVFDSALWFRVAVVAVPLVGLFLLVLIVAAAVRMLRGDHLLLVHHRRRRRHIVVSVEEEEEEEERQFVFEKHRRTVCGAARNGGGGGGTCPNHHHGYPPATTSCWLEFNDDDRCCDVRTCECRRKCVCVSSDWAVGIHAPLASRCHPHYSRRIHAKTPPNAAASREPFPVAAAAAAGV